MSREGFLELEQRQLQLPNRFNGFDFKYQDVNQSQQQHLGQPHAYPTMGTVPGMIPNMMPMPMMTMRPAAEMEYNRWLSMSQSYAQLAHQPGHLQYRTSFYPNLQNPTALSRGSPYNDFEMIAAGMNGGIAAQGMEMMATNCEGSTLPNNLNMNQANFPPIEDTTAGQRYGPGPPIVTSDRVKGPHGCNLFVFHLPNEITNW